MCESASGCYWDEYEEEGNRCKYKNSGGVTKTATPTKVTKSAVVTPDITITVPNTGAVPTVKADTPW